jgi:hypothetical protein
MNKAFVRESDSTDEFCPRCGVKGEPVGRRTMAAYLAPEVLTTLAEPANFCPSAACEVAYFDAFERVVLIAALQKPVWPKHPDAPICACFGLTRADIEQDARQGVTERVKAVLEHAKSAAACCGQTAANGRPCTAQVQKCYLQCRQAKRG